MATSTGGGWSLPDPASGVRLAQAAYQQDFGERRWLADGRDSWKLERMQEYQEPGFASWEAFAEGDWERAMQLRENERPGLLLLSGEGLRHRSVFHRIRVIEEPISRYLQWELHFLMLRAELCERIRVVGAGQVAPFEPARPLPEFVSLCGQTLYQVLYTCDALPAGAIRFTDPGIVAGYEEFAESLYLAGEDIEPYFRREIAPLPPPSLRG